MHSCTSNFWQAVFCRVIQYQAGLSGYVWSTATHEATQQNNIWRPADEVDRWPLACRPPRNETPWYLASIPNSGILRLEDFA